MTCPSCGTENRPGARFCDHCGALLAEAAPPRRFTPPEALAQKLREHAHEHEGERKQVTVLFADVSGSMDLSEQIDPEAWRTIMDRFFGVLTEGVHRFEGTVVQFTGDGIMALFGAPIAHEDHAVRAAHAALRLRDDLAEHAAAVRREQGLNFSVRLGLNSGEVVVGALGDDLRVDFTAIGHTVGLAKRMESLAEPGRAYVTAATAALLDGYFALEDLGAFDVKGVRDPVRVFALEGVGKARTRLDLSRARGFSRFVGRMRELRVLEEALERALAGDGRVLVVTGEAGVGKSRLFYEFSRDCRARGLPVYHASGAAHAQRIPFYAALGMLRGYFGLEDGMGEQEMRERIAGRLLLLDPALGEELPLVFDFLGVPDPQRPPPRMDPDARLRRLLAAARTMTRAQAAREPAVNLFEDLHWVDDGSLMFLRALVEAVPGQRSLVAVNTRPGPRPRWLAGDHVDDLPLVPLGTEALDELLRDLLGDDPSLDGLPDQIRERTGGNPFFVEELVRSLVEDGKLAGTRGAYTLCCPLREVRVPPSVHGVLAERIDRLGERDKVVLQAAAVLGREVPERVLERVAGAEELTPAIDALIEADFLVDGSDGLRFRHALTQEVAYGTLLAERRRRAHCDAAEALAELEAGRGDERAAEVARHWDLAGDRLQAARWHQRAAAWAGSNDPEHAAEHWRAVRDHCDVLPETPETLGLGVAARGWLMQTSWRLGISRDELDSLHAEARERALKLGDEALAAMLTATWSAVSGLAYGLHGAMPAAEEALAVIEAAGRPDLLIPALIPVIYGMTVEGRLAEALARTSTALELLERDPTIGAGVIVLDPHSYVLMMRGFLTGLMGDPEAGLALLKRSIALATERGDLETAGWSHMQHALMAYFGGTLEGSYEHAGRSVEIADRIGSVFSRIWAYFNLGLAHHLHGRHADAVATFDECLGLIHRHGTGRECEPWALTMRAMALAACARHDEAAVAARAALQLAQERGVRNAVPAAHHALGLSLLPSEPAAAAERFETSIAEARAFGQVAQVRLAERSLEEARALLAQP